jgi:hypothetical protein
MKGRGTTTYQVGTRVSRHTYDVLNSVACVETKGNVPRLIRIILATWRDQYIKDLKKKRKTK